MIISHFAIESHINVNRLKQPQTKNGCVLCPKESKVFFRRVVPLTIRIKIIKKLIFLSKEKTK